ncbi:hypothetical protein DY000_02015187 [Brassica cretica]|uniref:Uncharacterized protein n=1 Tax=Brassica cretica TaxID=69181 RepID=A0ABQ7D2K1_BRACR|nr:hypothetical protein DY000_02015187 [Brassica cretica]
MLRSSSHHLRLSVDRELCAAEVTAPHYGSFFWSLAYNGNIEPVPDMSTSYNVPDAIATMKVHPLMTRRLPGRPKRARYLSTETKEKGETTLHTLPWAWA